MVVPGQARISSQSVDDVIVEEQQPADSPPTISLPSFLAHSPPNYMSPPFQGRMRTLHISILDDDDDSYNADDG